MSAALDVSRLVRRFVGMEAHVRRVHQRRLAADAARCRRLRLEDDIRALPFEQRILLKAIMRRDPVLLRTIREPPPSPPPTTTTLLPSIEISKMKTYMDMVEGVPDTPPLRLTTKSSPINLEEQHVKSQMWRWLEAVDLGDPPSLAVSLS